MNCNANANFSVPNKPSLCPSQLKLGFPIQSNRENKAKIKYANFYE